MATNKAAAFQTSIEGMLGDVGTGKVVCARCKNATKGKTITLGPPFPGAPAAVNNCKVDKPKTHGGVSYKPLYKSYKPRTCINYKDKGGD